MKALVLDFDGVISDSVPEAFFVALRTYLELYPYSLLAQKTEHLVQSKRLCLADIQLDPIYRAFLTLMPLGNRAEDYGVILSIIEHEIEIKDQAEYDRQRNAKSLEELGRFHERFYQVREEFFTTDPVGWHTLIGPYSDFVDILRRRASGVVLAIATAKDRHSVARLLSNYGIADLFPEEHVMDKETGLSKAAHLQLLRQRLGLEYPQISFMDDKVNHLDAVAPLGIRCALATWGYNGAREHQLAQEKGYLVCGLEDVEKKVFG